MLISKFENDKIESKIVELESDNCILLPKQYRTFLCKYNGGYTPKTKFKVGKISSDIRGFYGLGDVEYTLDKCEIKKWIQEGFFPVANDSFGNYILIGVEEKKYGKIFFSNHEEGNKMECIGEDFVSFLANCKSDKISDTAKKTIKEREAALIAKGRESVITNDLRQMWQKEIDKYRNITQEAVIID